MSGIIGGIRSRSGVIGKSTFIGVQARVSTTSGGITSHNTYHEVGSNQATFGTQKWTTEKVNGGTFSNDTGRFTATKAGFYVCTGSFIWSAMDDGQNLYVLLSKNGATATAVGVFAYERQHCGADSNGIAVSVAGQVELNGSSDYVSMFWNTSNTGSGQTVSIGTRLSCTYIGI